MLRTIGLPVTPVVLALPIIELSLGGWLISTWHIVLGLSFAASLLSVFSVILVAAIRQGYDGECVCFGSRGDGKIGLTDVVSNVALVMGALFSAWVVFSHGDTGLKSLLEIGWSDSALLFTLAASLCALRIMGRQMETMLALSRRSLLNDTALLFSHVVLWCMVVLLYGAVYLLYRHLGEPIRRQAEDLAKQGPEVGKEATLEVTTASGATYALETNIGKPHVIVFAAPRCGYCERVRDLIGALGKAREQALTLMIIYGGDQEATRAYVRSMPPTVVSVADPKREIFKYWKVQGTPYAVVAAADGKVLAKGAAGSKDSVESHFKKALVSRKAARQVA